MHNPMIIDISSIAKRVTSTFFTFFHIFSHFSSLPVHFPNSCCKLHCSKKKLRLPHDTFDGHFNFEPETICFRKFEQGSASNISPKLLYFPALRHESFS